MKAVFAAGIALVIAAGAATAADLPRAPVFKAPVAEAAGWTGFYLGVGVGGRWLNSDWRTTETFQPGLGPIPFFTTDPKAKFDSNAFRISGYAGYNIQVAPLWVIGIEADVGWADNKDTLPSRIPGLGAPNFGSFTEVTGRGDGSVRARAGYLINPSILVYATGGIAFQQVKAIATCPSDTSVCNPAAGTQSFSRRKTMTGWTAGAGVEGMIRPNWLGRIEYRYAEFERFSFTAIPVTIDTFGANARLGTATHTVTVGLAYKTP